MENIAIITYHAAYNYGSVLQAYATQFIVEKLGYGAEIINYRMQEQHYIYSLYRTKYGLKTFLKDLMQLPVYKERKLRQEKFERFITSKMNLSKECVTPEDVYKSWESYKTIISGSDQIWNKHSLELENSSPQFMDPYLLRDFTGKKISYASSIANMSDDELNLILPQINKFDFISMRESSSADRMRKLLHKEIPTVLDPTFLLDKAEWCQIINLKVRATDEKYILYYSLAGLKPLKENAKILKKIASTRNLKVKIITPFAYLKLDDEIIEMHPEVGPEDFLQLIYDAEMVVTNSYHGTILSINLEKDVYSLCESGGSEFRKTDILKKLGMEERIIHTVEDLEKHFAPIDYQRVHSKLEFLRSYSYKYLKTALAEERKENFHENM